MRLRRGYFALATISGLALLTYSCSDDKKGSSSAGAATGTVGTTGTPTTTGGATMGTTGDTTGATSVGGSTTTSTASTGMGGATTGMGGASAGGAGGAATTSTDGGAGEGGEGPGTPSCDDPAGEIVYTFDEPGTLGGWSIRATDYNEGGLADSFLMRSATEGVSCPGALTLTIPFSVYGENESAEAQANFTADWSGYTTLYASVRVAEPAGGDLGYLNGIQLFTNSAAYSMYHGAFVSGRTFEDFEWHEIEIDLTMETDLTDVNQLGVQLLVWTDTAAGMDGGVENPPAAPETTTVYIDDIRLE